MNIFAEDDCGKSIKIVRLGIRIAAQHGGAGGEAEQGAGEAGQVQEEEEQACARVGGGGGGAEHGQQPAQHAGRDRGSSTTAAAGGDPGH